MFWFVVCVGGFVVGCVICFVCVFVLGGWGGVWF